MPNIGYFFKDSSGLECLTINTKLSNPQPYLNPMVWFYVKIILKPPPPTTIHHPPTPTQTQCQKYLSCYCLDFNFKGRFLGTYRKVSNCHSDICPNNICPCDICPYKEYPGCYWQDFDQTLKIGSWNHIFTDAFFWNLNINFLDQIFLCFNRKITTK